MGIEMEGMLDTYLHYKDGKSTFKGADAEANNEAIINYLKEYPAKMIDEKGNITGYKYEYQYESGKNALCAP